MVASTDKQALCEGGGWTLRGSLAIGAMAAMSFAVVSAEIMPIAVLTPLALDLKISEGFAGQAITMTALFAGIAAPMITILIGQVDRKRVLLLLSLSAIVANLLAVVASGLVVLLLARVLLGVALGGFFGLAAAAVVQIVSMRRLGVGMSLVFLGMSGATVLAPPFGTLIESVFGWRSVFLCTGAIAVVALILQLAFLPRIPAREANDIGRVFVLLKLPAIVIGLLVSMVFMGGHIAGFAFIRPRLEASGFDTGEIAVCLLGYGVSNVIGMALGGFMADKSLRSGLCVAAAGMGGGTMVLWTGIGGFATTVLILAVWGAAVGLAPASLQTWVGKAAPEDMEAGGALLLTGLQFAIALASVLGGTFFDSFGPRAPMAITAACGWIVLMILAMASPPGSANLEGGTEKRRGTYGDTSRLA